MPADLIVLLSFARSNELTTLVEGALKARHGSLASEDGEPCRPFIEWLGAEHFHFLDRINAALARESARSAQAA